MSSLFAYLSVCLLAGLFCFRRLVVWLAGWWIACSVYVCDLRQHAVWAQQLLRKRFARTPHNTPSPYICLVQAHNGHVLLPKVYICLLPDPGPPQPMETRKRAAEAIQVGGRQALGNTMRNVFLMRKSKYARYREIHGAYR